MASLSIKDIREIDDGLIPHPTVLRTRAFSKCRPMRAPLLILDHEAARPRFRVSRSWREPGSPRITATSFASGVYGSSGLVGTLAANPAMPVVFSGGAVNSASYAVARSLPEAGSRFLDRTWPPHALGTQVLLGGEELPLQVVAPGLVNAIVPTILRSYVRR
jgi:hypothetical protein